METAAAPDFVAKVDHLGWAAIDLFVPRDDLEGVQEEIEILAERNASPFFPDESVSSGPLGKGPPPRDCARA